MTALVLQARLDSSRLPEKSILPLGGRPLILRVMEALSSLPADVKILACPEDSVSSFQALAEEAGFVIIPGPKDDVLARYCLAIRKSGADRVIRATGDNPFVFMDAALALKQEAESLGVDYAGYTDLPHGAGVESVSSDALLRAEKETSEVFDREHVCPYLYNNPGLFSLYRPKAPEKWQGPEIRISVDTIEDYHKAEILYKRIKTLPAQERHLGENIMVIYKVLGM